MAITLAAVDQSRLSACEKIIERGLSAFMEVGEALLTIRENRLYRASHATFEDYCEDRWQFSKRRANQLIAAFEVGTMVPVSSERQARELAPLRDEPERIAKVWDGVSQATAAQGTLSRPTARAIREAVAAEADETGSRLISDAVSGIGRLVSATELAPRSVVIGMNPRGRGELLTRTRRITEWLIDLIAELERVEER